MFGAAHSGQNIYGDLVLNLLQKHIDRIESAGERTFVIGASSNEAMFETNIVATERLRILNIDQPNPEGLKEIFNIHTKNLNVSQDIDVDNMMNFLYEYNASGYDIVSIIREANRQAYLRQGIYDKMKKGTFKQSDLKKVQLTIEDFENAINNDFVPRIPPEPEPDPNAPVVVKGFASALSCNNVS